MARQLPWTLIDQIRKAKPIVLTLANIVTIDKVADSLSAIGASPIMSTGSFEATAMANLADAIAINLGTVNPQQLSQIRAVLNAAPAQTPLILDPVAVGSINERLEIAQDLLRAFPVTVIRGNASEIAALVGHHSIGHGIDAGDVSNSQKLAVECAQYYHTFVVMTGPTDIITDGKQTYCNNVSTPLLATNVGSGDMLTSIIGAYLSLSDDYLAAAVVATKMLTFAGKWAAQDTSGLGSWQVKFYDYLSQMTSTKIGQLIESEQNDNDK